jgi:hypothetical protein
MAKINRSVSFILCLLSWIGTLRAQVPQAPLPTESSPIANAPPTHQLSVNVRRVVVDVVVTDAKGNPVEGLKAGRLQTDGEWSDPTDPFLRCAQRRCRRRIAAGARSPLASGHFFQSCAGPDGQARHSPAVRHAGHASGVVSQCPPGVGEVHQRPGEFHEDRHLRADRPLAHAAGLHRRRDPADAGRQFERSNIPRLRHCAPRPSPRTCTTKLLFMAEIEELEYLGIKRHRITIDAFIEIARYVSALPGRKNLIWMSGSFPSEIFSHGIRNAGSQCRSLMTRGFERQRSCWTRVAWQFIRVDVRGLDRPLSVSNRGPNMPP